MNLTQSPSTILSRSRFGRITLAHLLLAGIVLLSAFLHFANLNAIGNANEYYTAAVKSMLTSWHNFFFIAAEPGGSVTVDKPPLGLWVEAAFAFALGVQGWVVALPNMLSGLLSLSLLYGMVKKHLGELAGLVAALTLAVTPVFVATNRNNTMDGLLTFTLLLAAWAFLRATESGRLRWLLLGGLLVWLAALLLAVGAGVLWLRPKAGAFLLLAALLFIPLIWTGLTTFDGVPDVNLPTAYSPSPNGRTPTGQTNDALLRFLQANPPGTDYLVAVPDSHTGAPLVLATGQPVLYMGGFGGGDPVVSAAQGESRGRLVFSRKLQAKVNIPTTPAAKTTVSR
ncbi:MAG: hypothetical protein Fur0018_24660 [Anaerolineales bacterium]